MYDTMMIKTMMMYSPNDDDDDDDDCNDDFNSYDTADEVHCDASR